jgi:glutaconate CoA-transferase subunit A
MARLKSLRDAVASLIRDGNCGYPAGFAQRIRSAAGHETIHRKRKQFVLARAAWDQTYDQRTAGGCARMVIFSYAGNPGVGLLKAVLAETETGRLEAAEDTHFSMVSHLTAGGALRRAAESGSAR